MVSAEGGEDSRKIGERVGEPRAERVALEFAGEVRRKAVRVRPDAP